jgi:UvrD/REP helicase N-terminal domain/UvrD-like helicase C-terminal domain
MIKAGAGTGKTFTVTQGVHAITYSPKFNYDIGTDEQKSIWDLMKKDEYPGRIHMTSFTTDASEQLAAKCPIDASGKATATSSSTYGLGLRYAKQSGQAGYVDKWGWKYWNHLANRLGKSRKECNESRPGMWDAINEVQGFARLALKPVLTQEDFIKLADHFGIRWERGWLEEAVATTNLVIQDGMEETGKYDYTDMIFMPLMHGLIKKEIDTLVVDEFQDMNRAQQEICLLASWKRILIGDPHQAIYGFSGADQDAFDRLEKYLGMTAIGVSTLPLTLTRRCSKAVTREANKIVESLRHRPDAPEGSVAETNKERFMKDDLDRLINKCKRGIPFMAICPTNAPLISLMFKLKKRGINSYVQGKDVTATMIKFVEKAETFSDLKWKLDAKLDELRHRKQSRNRDAELDKIEALHGIAQECISKDDVIQSISSMFSDDPINGWMPLRSVHKAKGLEHETVVFWEEDRCNSPYSELEWQHRQDRNLRYVGITRAKDDLIKVSSRS